MNTDGIGGDDSEVGVAYPHQDLTHSIIGAAMAVHTELGSGFLEKVYENALAVELRECTIQFKTQVPIPVTYKGQAVGTYFADMIIAESVLCEIKAIDALSTVHEGQVLHYLKATGIKVGLLLNFGSRKLHFKRLIR
ncbi:MAG: GxxExxY protein [Dehalococcoidia bacterium]